jgi:hypothetical protein
VTYSDEEWGLLVGLPQSVVVAASAAESDGDRKTAGEAEAGLMAISAGRESPNPLIARIAGELVARVGDPEAGEGAPVIKPADPAAAVADVLERAAAAARLLAVRADDGDAAAYAHWLVTIADEVVGAERSGGVLGIGGDTVTESERRFRDRLAEVLRD